MSAATLVPIAVPPEVAAAYALLQDGARTGRLTVTVRNGEITGVSYEVHEQIVVQPVPLRAGGSTRILKPTTE